MAELSNFKVFLLEHIRGTTGGLVTDFKGHFNVITGVKSVRMQSDLSRMCSPPLEYEHEEIAEQRLGRAPDGAGCFAWVVLLGYTGLAAIISLVLLATMGNKTHDELSASVAIKALLFIAVLFLPPVLAWKFYFIPRMRRRVAAREKVLALAHELWTAAMADYEHSFLCLKCGTRFVSRDQRPGAP